MEAFNQEQDELIAKHLSGESTAEEEQRLREWLKEKPEHAEYLQQLTTVWNSAASSDQFQPNVEAAWEKVKQKTGLTTDAPVKVIPFLSARNLLRIAAVLVPLLILTFAIKSLWPGESKRKVYSATLHKREFLLPDSSLITLNKNSILTLADDFNEDNREVFLNGEAFFEVRKDKIRPFLVQGHHSRTQVLGTSFNVKSRPQKMADEVEVVTGRVSFAANSDDTPEKVVLLPGDKANALKNGTVRKAKTIDPNFMAWRREQLVFKNTPLPEVAQALENYYQQPITLSTAALQNCRFTGTFTKPELKEVLKVLSAATGLTYQRNKNAYLLSGKGCTP